MASPIIAETIRSKRGKDKLVLFGFIYTLNRSTEEFQHWLCEKRGQCKARLTTRSDLVVVKPCDMIQIQETHTHGSDKPRIEMLNGYNQMKERASQNSEESTRSIFASGVAIMGTSSLVQKTRKPKQLNEQFENIKMVLKVQTIQHMLLIYKFSKCTDSLQRVNRFYCLTQVLGMTTGYLCLAHLKWFQFSQHLSLGMQMEHLK